MNQQSSSFISEDDWEAIATLGEKYFFQGKYLLKERCYAEAALVYHSRKTQQQQRASNNHSNPVRIRNLDFPSQAAAARHFKVSSSLITRALDEGTIDQIGLKKPQGAAKPLFVNGVPYGSIALAAEALGMSKGLLSSMVAKFIPGKDYTVRRGKRKGTRIRIMSILEIEEYYGSQSQNPSQNP